MNAIFVANIEINYNEGIFKKVCAQAKAVANIVGKCILIVKHGNGSAIANVYDMEWKHTNQTVLEKAINLISLSDIDVLYIRAMVPNFKLIKLMHNAKIKKAKVYYEIPTYPFYAEQFRASRKKYRAIAKIGLNILFNDLIYSLSENIIIVKSNSKVHLRKKMKEITNGVDIESIQSKSYSTPWDGTLRMVGVGTFSQYHGYDRLIRGLSECNENVDGYDIEFHIVGAGVVADELKKLVEQLGLKNVFFHGVKTTEQLNDMYERFDVGIGCLALHRRNADIDTTLKIIEYYCRGVPVVSSGVTPFDASSYTIHVQDGEDAINIVEIFRRWKNIKEHELVNLSEDAKKKFNWNSIMKNALGD